MRTPTIAIVWNFEGDMARGRGGRIVRVIRRRVAAMVAALLSVGAVSACGDDDGQGEPSSTTVSPLGPDSSSSSSSTEPTSSSGSGSPSSSTDAVSEDDPQLPAAAKEHDQAGAVAFAKFYWEESGRALHTGETQSLAALSTNCVPCDEYVRLVEEDAEKGLRANIDPTVIGETKVTNETDGKSDQAVTLSVRDQAYELVDSEGKSHGHAKAVDYDIIVYLDWRGSGWTVIDDFMLS